MARPNREELKVLVRKKFDKIRETNERRREKQNNAHSSKKSIIHLVDQLGRKKFGEEQYNNLSREVNEEFNRLEPQFKIET